MLDTDVAEAVTAAAASAEDEPEPAVCAVQLMSSTTRIGALTLSREFDEIVAAMGEIQFAVNQAGLTADAKNEVLQNAYAPLPVILKSLSPHLKNHGVTLLQPFEVKDRTIRVTTILLKGKQYASMTAEMLADNAFPQAIGSAITYCCRYSVRAVLGLAIDVPGDEDDDGNVGSGRRATARDASVGNGSDLKSSVQGSDQGQQRMQDSSSGQFSDALRGYLKRVKTADLTGLNAAESQVQAFKLGDEERKILIKAIHDRKAELSEAA